MDPPPLDHPRSADELAADAGQTITERGPRRPRGAAHLRRGARPGHDLGRPPAATCRSSPARRPRRPMLFDLVVGASSIYGGSWLRGRRRGLRREPGAALDRRPRRACRPRRAASSSRAAPTATCPRSSRRATRGRRAPRRPAATRWRVVAAGSAHSSVRSSAAVMDVDVLVVPTPDQRLTRRRARSRRSTRTAPTTSSPSWPPPAAPTSASSTTSPGSHASPRSAGSGSTSTARTGPPRSPHPRCATCSTASSAATRSRSTRTSGSSRRSTAARSSTATRCRHAAPTPRRPSTSTRCRRCATGTRPTSPSTSRDAPAACRSGSPWRRTAPRAYTRGDRDDPGRRPPRRRRRSRAARSSS